MLLFATLTMLQFHNNDEDDDVDDDDDDGNAAEALWQPHIYT